ncbi:hypothetical protein STEG23_023452, partial [Scotinomys teguina]
RSSSFGNFDRFRNNSTSKSDDSTEVHEEELTRKSEEERKPSNNGANLSKKMRAISWTMKKKVGKKYIKALSEEKEEENGEDAIPSQNGDPIIGTHTEKNSLKPSDSMDSLYSGQSSSSGITSCSDGTSNRDSFRLDDDSPYSGSFCGRARVHTDFTPSPYDTDSLKIKKGDIIDIICKTPMGMWTGMLNNKVGNFKFIYVDVISEEEAAPKKIKAPRSNKRESAKTLQDFLESIHLQEYTSTLLLNGYETLEDLKDIQESHLVELNIANPEDRMRLLSAAESLLDEETTEEQENESVPLSLRPDVSTNSKLLHVLMYIVIFIINLFSKFAILDKFQKATNDKKRFLRLPASENSIQKVLKTETQGINAMQVAAALRTLSTSRSCASSVIQKISPSMYPLCLPAPPILSPASLVAIQIFIRPS